MSRLRGRRRGRISESGAFQTINITPFTDVLLVLLIIFLIAGSSLAPTGLDVDELASPAQTGSLSKEAEREEGTLFVGGKGRLFYAFEERVSVVNLEELDPRRVLNLTAPPGTAMSRVVAVYDELLRSGFTRVRLAAPQPLPLKFEQ